jgi:DNA replication protein DnaC
MVRHKHRIPSRKLTPDDLVRMRLPEKHRKASPDRFPRCKEAVLSSYLKRFHEAMRRNIGLFIYGDEAVGKTSCAAVIAKHARRLCYTVYWTSMVELREAVVQYKNFDEGVSVLDRVLEVDLLVIDDVDLSILDSKFPSKRFMQILNTRINYERMTMFTGRFLNELQFDEEMADICHQMRGHLVSVYIEGGDALYEDEQRSAENWVTGGDDGSR